MGFGRGRRGWHVVRCGSRLFVHRRRRHGRRRLRQAHRSAKYFTLRGRRSRRGGATPVRLGAATRCRHRRDVERRSAAQPHRDRCADGSYRKARGRFDSDSPSRMCGAAHREEAREHGEQCRRHHQGSSQLHAGTPSTFADPAPLDANRVHDDGHTIGWELLGLRELLGPRHMSTRTGSLPRRIEKPVYFPT